MTKQKQPSLGGGRFYSTGEEIANAVTHGIGAAGGIIGLIFMLLSSTDAWQVVSSAIYGFSMIVLFTMSCLYHSLTNERAKRVMRIFDHTSIYLLIAGTYTPFTLVTLRGPLGWVLFGIVWGACIFGVVLNAISIERFKKLSMICYVAAGWAIVIAIWPMIQSMAWPGLVLLFVGGLFYTGGILFYRRKDKPWFHAIWHVAVLAGAVCHFFCIYLYVLG